jgi:hypothetical protein
MDKDSSYMWRGLGDSEEHGKSRIQILEPVSASTFA